MKKILALFAASALCACAPAAETAPAAAGAPAPDLSLRVKSLDALREAVTAATAMAGSPQVGLMATMGLAGALGQAGLATIRPADPACLWVWDVVDLVEAAEADSWDFVPSFLVALPVADPSTDVFDSMFERDESVDEAAPPVWKGEDGVDLVVTVRDGWTLVATRTELFDRAAGLLARPAALPEATFSVESADDAGAFLSRFFEWIDRESGGGALDAVTEDGLPEGLATALVSFATELQRDRLAMLKDLQSVRAGVRCDLTNGIVFAGSATAKPGTRTAALVDGMKTPVDPAALAAIPADAIFWGAVGNAAELRPGEPDYGRLAELARKHLLPVVPGEERRARVDALLATLPAAVDNVRSNSGWFGTDADGRVHAHSAATYESVERARSFDAAFAQFLRDELAACTNAAIAAAFDVPADNLSFRVRVRVLADALADALADVAGADDEDLPFFKRAVEEIAVAFFGEDFVLAEEYAAATCGTEIGAAGAELPPHEPVAPDFSAEGLFFPGQVRTLAAGFDIARLAAFKTAAAKAAEAVKAVARENAEAKGEEFDEEELAGFIRTLDDFAPALSPSPILVTYGKKDGALTETVVVPPAFVRNVKVLAELGEARVRGAIDEAGVYDWDEEDDELWADDDDDDDEYGDEDFDDDDL